MTAFKSPSQCDYDNYNYIGKKVSSMSAFTLLPTDACRAPSCIKSCAVTEKSAFSQKNVVSHPATVRVRLADVKALELIACSLNMKLKAFGALANLKTVISCYNKKEYATRFYHSQRLSCIKVFRFVITTYYLNCHKFTHIQQPNQCV